MFSIDRDGIHNAVGRTKIYVFPNRRNIRRMKSTCTIAVEARLEIVPYLFAITNGQRNNDRRASITIGVYPRRLIRFRLNYPSTFVDGP